VNGDVGLADELRPRQLAKPPPGHVFGWSADVQVDRRACVLSTQVDAAG
jgi:hypothetical protein